MVLDELEEHANHLRTAEPVLRGFAAWLGTFGTEGLGVLNSLVSTAEVKGNTSRDYHDIAVLGFACARNIGEEYNLEERFQDGLSWMQGRRFFLPNQAPGFEADGIAIIGFAAGILASGDPSTRQRNQSWLESIITRSIERAESQEWETSLLHAAQLILSGSVFEHQYPRDIAADLAAALASTGLIDLTEDQEREARLAIINPSFRDLSLDRAAVQAVALRWLMRSGAQALPKRATLNDVVQMLQNVPHALKRWPWEDKPKTTRAGVNAQKWDLQNEYHVQSLLWAILAPIFSDLEDEEYLKSLGHKHPRADLAIPSLGLIIEVKFVRNGTQSDFSGVINEISADTGLYLSTSSEFTKIVAFVWDHSRSGDQHAELLSGLRRLRGIADAVVVSRPGRWETPAP